MSHYEYGPLSTYTSLADPGLAEYFQNKNVKKHLMRSGLITKEGEIVSDNVYRMKNAKKEKERFLEVRLLQAIVHKSLDMERTRQVEVRKKLEEISRIELVQRIRAQERHLQTRDSLPMLNPSARRAQSASLRRSDDNKKQENNEHRERFGSDARFDDDEELIDVDRCRQRLRRKLGKEELDTKHLTALDSLGMREYGRVLEHRQRQTAYNPFSKPMSSRKQRKSSERRKRPKSSNRASPSESTTKGPSRGSQSEQQALTSSQRSKGRKVDNEHNKSRRSPNRGYAEIHRTEPILHAQAGFQSLCDITMIYHGPKEIVDTREPENGTEESSSVFTEDSEVLERGNKAKLHEIVIWQQPSGGNTLMVYRGKHVPGDTFEFTSRRHRNCPFGLTIYVNDVVNCRVSACCEYRHKINARLGSKMGHFSFTSVKGAAPCFKCQVIKKKKKKPPTKSISPESSSTELSISSHQSSDNLLQVPEEVAYSSDEKESKNESEEEQMEGSRSAATSSSKMSEEGKDSDVDVEPVKEQESPHVEDNAVNEPEEQGTPDFTQVSARSDSNPPSARESPTIDLPQNAEIKQVDVAPSSSSTSPSSSRNETPRNENDEGVDFIVGTKLVIENQTISDKHMTHIKKDLSSAQEIDQIVIKSTQITPDDLECIFSSLPHPDKLQYLILENIAMTSRGAAVVERFLPKCTGLFELILEENPLGDMGVHHIVKGLKERHISTESSAEVLQCVSLCNVAFHKHSLDVLGDMLGENIPIKRLELSDNGKQSVDQWISMGRGLEKNCILEELAVADCNMDNEDVNALVGFLNEDSNLRLLDLTENNLDDECVPKLCGAIQKCSKLTSILCESSISQISEEGVQKILDALERIDGIVSSPEEIPAQHRASIKKQPSVERAEKEDSNDLINQPSVLLEEAVTADDLVEETDDAPVEMEEANVEDNLWDEEQNEPYLVDGSIQILTKSVDRDQFKEVIKQLSRGRQIESVHIKCPNMEDEDFKNLFSHIEYHSSVQVVRISGLTITDEKETVLTNFLQECLQLEILEFNKVQMSSRCLMELCSAMEERDNSADTDLQGLQSLLFHQCNISNEPFSLEAIQEHILKTNVSVKELAITFAQDVPPPQWIQFMETVVHHQSLKTLDLHGCRMELETCQAMLEKLKEKTRLRKVDLSTNLSHVDPQEREQLRFLIEELKPNVEVLLE